MEENIHEFYKERYGDAEGLSEMGVDGVIGGFFMWCRHAVGSEFRCFSMKGIGKMWYSSFDLVLRTLEDHYRRGKMDKDSYERRRGEIMEAMMGCKRKRTEKMLKMVRQAKERFGEDYDVDKLVFLKGGKR